MITAVAAWLAVSGTLIPYLCRPLVEIHKLRTLIKKLNEQLTANKRMETIIKKLEGEKEELSKQHNLKTADLIAKEKELAELKLQNWLKNWQKKQLAPTAESANTLAKRREKIKSCISSLVHAVNCYDANCMKPTCYKMKTVVQHTKRCRRKRVQCV